MKFFESKIAAFCFTACFGIIAIIASISILNIFFNSISIIGSISIMNFILLLICTIKIAISPRKLLLELWKSIFHYLGGIFLIIGFLFGIFIEKEIASAIAFFAFGCTLLSLRTSSRYIRH